MRRQSLPAAISQRAETGVGCTCPPKDVAPGEADQYGWSVRPLVIRPDSGSSTAVGEEPRGAEGIRSGLEERIIPRIGVG
ncbi:hypothetical protein ABZ646_32115 [Streptomyces sp. NPDC007162]|uniref:hypothetical protein n=1 Tax=Streptomyces sp. NPDC007162 TaxID=3156917 RepID=UPI0033F30E1F